MIHTIIKNLNGVDYRYTYSDDGRYVVNAKGALYIDVYDPINIIREYTEGDIIPLEEPTEEEMAEAGRIMMAYEHSGQSENTESEN